MGPRARTTGQRASGGRSAGADRGTRTVLVVGGADLAAQTVLELCIEDDVTLCSRRASLGNMTRLHRYKLNELAFENEITLWLRTAIERIERTPCGRLRVFLEGAGPASAVFDDVVECSEDDRPTMFRDGGRRRAG